MWKTLKLEEIVDISIGKTPSRGNPKFWDMIESLGIRVEVLT